jgi:hypothetical protein
LSLLTSFSLGSPSVLASSMRTLSRLLRISSFVDLASSLASQGGASFLDPLHVSCVVVCIDSLVGNSVFSKFAMSCCSFLLCMFTAKWSSQCPSFLSCQNQGREENDFSALASPFFTFNIEKVYLVFFTAPFRLPLIGASKYHSTVKSTPPSVRYEILSLFSLDSTGS